MPEEVAFVYDGSDHANDLRSCHYTPLKGLIANQENEGDWRILCRAYATALKRLGEKDGAEAKAEAKSPNPESAGRSLGGGAE